MYNNFDSAIEDCDVVIGTTGLWKKANINFKRAYLMEDAIGRVSRLGKEKTVGIIIGRDDIGLKKSEIEKCDMIAYIGTDPEYPVLNISHALGIMLYLLTKKGFDSAYKDMSSVDSDKKEMEFLFKCVYQYVGNYARVYRSCLLVNVS